MTVFKKILKAIPLILIIAMAIINLLFTILEYFYFRRTEILRSQQFIFLASTLLSIITIHLIILYWQIKERESRLFKNLLSAIKNFKDVDLKIFNSIEEQEEYVIKQIKYAKKGIHDLSWKEKIRDEPNLPKEKELERKNDMTVRLISKDCVYKEIFVFSNEKRREKMLQRISAELPGYSCKYYSDVKGIPRIQFIVIDNEEVIFASSEYPNHCSVKNKELASIFVKYYEEIWCNAIPIKEGSKIYEDTVEKIKKLELPS